MCPVGKGYSIFIKTDKTRKKAVTYKHHRPVLLLKKSVLIKTDYPILYIGIQILQYHLTAVIKFLKLILKNRFIQINHKEFTHQFTALDLNCR